MEFIWHKGCINDIKKASKTNCFRSLLCNLNISLSEYDLVHCNVVLTARDAFGYLELKTYAYLMHLPYLLKETVVITFSPSQSVAVRVEHHARNNRHVYGAVISEQLSRWFHYVVGTERKVVIVVIFPKLHVLAVYYHGQKYLLSLRCQGVYYLMRKNLVGQ